ncbi:probable dolichyl pyrophosphate Man9GlcNAc2 alpha-1,3-glucosyltransferase isoform X1 [Rhagoletis pomonella]|uniref:probable dolichyl pyrophosphate Man9GlcNAc2 alpha-1,3-glucosyltransferase isoform X1 n=1 Tax=Rhagoletis pomonella TaxID=28610 RepID=UPI001786A55C|nr:probable dolichyl pyrophosphate Man9GlcNAc2 alpha-1,3-glucosyltransferase isoform X1 [Rhagoletis pomonella]
MKINVIKADVIAALSVAVAIRCIVSLYSYSGAGNPPMYGDYEAQRHWQEITTNVQPRDWYRNTTENDLLYWGLDYPPITAYHSYIIGIVGKGLNESFVKLGESRGIESAAHKNFMRMTVLFADILLYLPAILIFGTVLFTNFKKSLLFYLLPMVFYPGQILIDNGHFQYNNVSLGLCLLAVAAIFKGRFYMGSFLYTLALNYKQMELYHALPFFIYLLRTCCDQKGFLSKLKTFAFIASTVLATFLVIWLPWLTSVTSILEVLYRLFPIGRGVFEDKVANFWCALNVVYKIKNKLQNQQMATLCLGVTAAFVLPINIHMFFNKRKQTFLLSLVSTAMAFYLFSFQVHEKSILLVAVPALGLFSSYPLETLWFLEATVFSMFPLYVKDGLVIPFFALLFIYHFCIKHILLKELNQDFKISSLSAISSISIFSMFFIALVSLYAPAPERYPFIWPLLICLHSFAHFFVYFGFCISHQISGEFNVKINYK